MAGYVQSAVSNLQVLGWVGFGYALKRTGLFDGLDGQTVSRFVVYITLPSLTLQSFVGIGITMQMAIVVTLSTVALLMSAAAGWFGFQGKHPRERALLAGCTAGSSVAFVALPVIAAVFGAAGVRTALLFEAANMLAVFVVSLRLFASAGLPFPEVYAHGDGGTYRGEWLGGIKQGFGVYTYSSKARYEGEWRNNLKEGRGVYHFPKGGVYEGEWSFGRMEGVGVRTFASGKVQAGTWRQGQLQAPLEEWQCALAVTGANEAATAAKRVSLGGASWSQCLQGLLMHPPAWAYIASIALMATRLPLPPLVQAITAPLAGAHATLALIAFGLMLDLTPASERQAMELVQVAAARTAPPLLLLAAAAALMAQRGLPAIAVVLLLGPLAMCALTPIPEQVVSCAHRFRLDEQLAAAAARITAAASLVLLPATALVVTFSASANSVAPLLSLLCGLAAVLVAGAVWARAQESAKRKVAMVFRGPMQPVQDRTKSQGVGTPAAALEAGADTGPAEVEAVQQLGEQQPADQQQPSGASPIERAQEQSMPSDEQQGDSAPAEASSSSDAEPTQPAPRRASRFQDVDPSDDGLSRLSALHDGRIVSRERLGAHGFGQSSLRLLNVPARRGQPASMHHTAIAALHRPRLCHTPHSFGTLLTAVRFC